LYIVETWLLFLSILLLRLLLWQVAFVVSSPMGFVLPFSKTRGGVHLLLVVGCMMPCRRSEGKGCLHAAFAQLRLGWRLQNRWGPLPLPTLILGLFWQDPPPELGGQGGPTQWCEVLGFLGNQSLALMGLDRPAMWNLPSASESPPFVDV